MRWLLLSTLLVQSAPAQSEADKLEAALKKFGDRNYRLKIAGKDWGTMTLKTRIEKECDQRRVLFEDSSVVGEVGEKSFHEIKESASIDRLRLISSRYELANKAHAELLIATVDRSKGKISVNGLESSIEITSSTIGEQAIYRLVCAAEQKVGNSFKVDILSLTAETLQADSSFRCIAKERIEIGGKQLEAFKWENKGSWKITKKVAGREPPLTLSVDNTYWVSPDGYLLRQTGMRGLEMVLDAK